MKLDIRKMFTLASGANGGTSAGGSMFMSGSGFAAEKAELESLQSSVDEQLDIINQTLDSLSDSWQDNDSAKVIDDGKSLVSELKNNIESVITSYKSDLDTTSSSAQTDVYTYGG